jgi:hypothetical protein
MSFYRIVNVTDFSDAAGKDAVALVPADILRGIKHHIKAGLNSDPG